MGGLQPVCHRVHSGGPRRRAPSEKSTSARCHLLLPSRWQLNCSMTFPGDRHSDNSSCPGPSSMAVLISFCHSAGQSASFLCPPSCLQCPVYPFPEPVARGQEHFWSCPSLYPQHLAQSLALTVLTKCMNPLKAQ